MSETESKSEEIYAVVEMMGHRKIVGRIEESRFGPGSLIRVDVLGAEGEFERTEHVGTSSIYCLTEVSKETAIPAAKSALRKPSFVYDIAPPSRMIESFGDDDDDY